MRMNIPRALSLLSMVAALVFFVSVGCPAPAIHGDEDEQHDVVIGEELPQEIEELATVPITWEEVAAEIQDSLSDSWPQFPEGGMYDAASILLGYANEREIDPIIVADEFADLANTILDMQPNFLTGREGGHQRALLVALDIYRGAGEFRETPCSQLLDSFEGEEGQVPRINTYLVAAIGYKESRFMERTEVGYSMTKTGQKVTNCRWCRGALGEEGMFQFMPGGWVQSLMPQGCSPFDRLCSVRGAAKALATIRCICIDRFGQRCSVDSYVAGYGASKLPAPEDAMAYRGVIRGREFLCRVRQDCDEWWPRDIDEAFALTL